MYAQLYIYDPAEALQTRMAHNPEAQLEIMETLQEELAAENYYALSYQHMHELLQEAEAVAARNHTEIPEVTMRFAPKLCATPGDTINQRWKRWPLCSLERMAALLATKML